MKLGFQTTFLSEFELEGTPNQEYSKHEILDEDARERLLIELPKSAAQ